MSLTKVSITGFFTKPGYAIYISHHLLTLVIAAIENSIIQKYSFPSITSTELEIYIDAETEGNEGKLKQNRTPFRKYLSYTFYLPYLLIVKNDKADPQVFISEFVKLLQKILQEAGEIPDAVFKTIEQSLQTETYNNPKYEYSNMHERIEIQNIISQAKANLKKKAMIE